MSKRNKKILLGLGLVLLLIASVLTNQVNKQSKIKDVYRPAPSAKPLGLIGSTNYFVTSSGSDSADGLSLATAKRTPAAACALIGSPGATVLIGNGLYIGSTLNAVDPTQALRPCNKSHTRVTALDRFNPPKLQLADNLYDTYNGVNLFHFFGAVTEIEVDHLLMDGGSPVWDSTVGGRNIDINIRGGDAGYGGGVPSNINIHDNVMTRGRSSHIFMQSINSTPLTGMVIERNIFETGGDGRHSTSGAIGAYDDALYVKATTGIVIRNNIIRNNRGPGISLQSAIDGVSLYNSAPVVENNQITGNGLNSGPGIYMYGTLDADIKNNYIAGNGSGVVVSAATSNPVIRQNTIINNNLNPDNGLTNTHYGVYVEFTNGYTATVTQNIVQGNSGGGLITGGTSSFSGSKNVIVGPIVNGGSMTGNSTTTATFVNGTYIPTTGSSAINLGSPLSGITTDLLGATRSATPTAGAVEYNVPYTAAPLTTSTPPDACTDVGSGSVSARLSAVVTAPTGTGITRTASNLSTFLTALGAAAAGDRIVLTANLTLTANVTMANSGTLTNPIVIAADTPLGRSITGPYTITTTGNNVTWHQITFTGMAVDSPLQVSQDATHGKNVRFSKNRFLNVGNGSGAASHGAIRYLNSLHGDGDGLSGTLIDSSGTVDGNVFEAGMKNIPIFFDQYSGNNLAIGNTVHGNVSLISGETEAIKVGFGFGNETLNTRLAYNTIDATWHGLPYTIGVKGSNVTVDHNDVGSGLIMNRQGNNNVYSDNCLRDGNVEGGGDSVTVIRNWGSSNGDPVSGLGPLTLWGRGKSGAYDGVTKPLFYPEATNWLVRDNVFISTTADLGSVNQQFNATADTAFPARGNVFMNNKFYRPSGSSTFFAVFGGSALLTANNLWFRDNTMEYTSGVPATTTTTAVTTTTVGGPGAGCVRTQAEAMTIGGGTMNTASSHGGASGGSYRLWDASGSYVEWSSTLVAGNDYSIKIGYSSTTYATRSFFADYSNAFDNVYVPQLFTVASTSGAWNSFTVPLPVVAASGVHDFSLSWNSFSPADVGTIELDYVDLCSTPTPTTTTSTTSTIPASTTSTIPPSTTVGSTTPSSSTTTVPASTTTIPGATTTTTPPLTCGPALNTRYAYNVSGASGNLVNLKDNNENTEWIAASASRQVLTLDLGTTRTVHKINIKWTANRAARTFLVESRSASATKFSTIALKVANSSTQNGGCYTLTTSASARYLKISLEEMEPAGLTNPYTIKEIAVS